MTEKYEKTCLNAKINYFDQQTACGASVRWSKYTTQVFYAVSLTFNSYRLEQLRDESELVASAEEMAAAREILARDPAFVLDLLTKMRSGLNRPMEK